MESRIREFFERYLTGIYFPNVRVVDVIEVLIVAFLIYHAMVWIKNTKAWMLLKGMIVLGVFVLIAAIFQMHIILWVTRNTVSIMAIAAVVVFQPELRRSLEKLGEKQFLTSVVPFDSSREKVRFSEQTEDDIVSAVFEMGEVCTGALLVVEHAIRLTEYENTGIHMDCLVSKQILLNIFEHNTPLHDGAIIIRGDRVVSATCYLPLSDNKTLRKDLGTRHRAALGMSEVCDALIIVVSEEKGTVTVAQGGSLTYDVSKESLKQYLADIRLKSTENQGLSRLWKGRGRNGKKADK